MRLFKTLAVAAVFTLSAAAVARAAEPPAGVAAPTKPVSAPPPTPEDIAAARANADAVIAKFGVADLFDNVTVGAIPSVRHKASGLVCHVDIDSPISNIHVYEGLPRGEDVSCNSRILTVTETLYATRYPQRPTAEMIVDASIEAIRQNFTKVKPFEGPSLSISTGETDLPTPVTVRLQARLQGKPVYTRSSAVVVGDWVFAQRVTAPLDDQMMADILAGVSLNRMLVDVQPKDGASPAPAPPPTPPAVGTQV